MTKRCEICCQERCICNWTIQDKSPSAGQPPSPRAAQFSDVRSASFWPPFSAPTTFGSGARPGGDDGLFSGLCRASGVRRHRLDQVPRNVARDASGESACLRTEGLTAQVSLGASTRRDVTWSWRVTTQFFPRHVAHESSGEAEVM